MSNDRVPPGIIVIPAEERMWTRTTTALLHVQDKMPPGSRLVLTIAPTTVAKKRNGMGEFLRENPNMKWGLCLDSDMTPPADVIQRLWRTAQEEGADLVQAPYVRKRPPHQPVGGRITKRGEASDPLRPCTSDRSMEWDYPTGESLVRRGEPVEMDMAGTGCLLIRREVFEALEEPWFCAAENGCGSDYNFTLRATDAGFKLVLDPKIKVGHVSSYAFDAADAARAERQEKVHEQIRQQHAKEKARRAGIAI